MWYNGNITKDLHGGSMLKKRVVSSLSILAIIIIIASTYSCIKVNNMKKSMQNRIDHLFIESIGEASGGLNVSYDKMNDRTKKNYYVRVVSNLKLSSSLVPLTSYNKGRYLKESIDNLYLFISDEAFDVSLVGREDQFDIYNHLIEIMINPGNDEKNKELFDLIQNLRKKTSIE